MLARPHPDFRLRPAMGRGRLGQQQIADIAETLRRQGAIVDVEVSTPGSAAGGATPPPQRVKALIDTGASISTVAEEIAASAGLVPTGSVQLGGVGGSGQRTVYAAAVGLPQYGAKFDPIELAGVSVPFAGVQMLLGRDMLKRLRLDYQGPQGAFFLEQKNGAPVEAERAPGVSEAPSAIPVLVGVGAAGVAVAALALLGVL